VRNELGRAEREFIVDELIKNRVLKVYLTGGEPLLCPEIISYIRKLRRHKIFIEIITNGTLLDDGLIRELKKTKLLRVQVSINGSTPRINDFLMGVSYERIISSLQKLILNGISTHVKITITRKNIADMPNIINRLYRLGIREMELCEVIPLGRGFARREELTPAEQDLVDLRDKIARFKAINGMRVNFRSFSLTLKENGRASTCSVGHPSSRTCLIMQDGDVIPCTSASVWRLKNNVIEKGLKECWLSLEGYRRFLNYSKLKGKCGSCRLKKECLGGCRALAYQFTNDLWGEYPLCPYPTANDDYQQAA
jgi:radical SAM protein with 4Fe4S-binding SPASM domain